MNTPYDFEKQYREWARIPVDDFGYLTADEILALHPLQLHELLGYATAIRWDPKGWRNKDDKLLEFMKPAKWKGKTVLDYGCGIGLDTLRFAFAGARVWPADMHPKNLVLVQNILSRFAPTYADYLVLTLPHWPWFCLHEKIDLFWSLGVLHHTPHIAQILESACKFLNPGGECRIVLYSDKRWEQMMGEPVPTGPTHEHARFQEFCRKCDAVGNYADWYHGEKLQVLVEPFAKVARWEYLCNNQMIGAVIKPK